VNAEERRSVALRLLDEFAPLLVRDHGFSPSTIYDEYRAPIQNGDPAVLRHIVELLRENAGRLDATYDDGSTEDIAGSPRAMALRMLASIVEVAIDAPAAEENPDPLEGSNVGPFAPRDAPPSSAVVLMVKGEIHMGDAGFLDRLVEAAERVRRQLGLRSD
jgi:hypothetical protein